MYVVKVMQEKEDELTFSCAKNMGMRLIYRLAKLQISRRDGSIASGTKA
jgi:hypothetical protein